MDGLFWLMTLLAGSESVITVVLAFWVALKYWRDVEPITTQVKFLRLGIILGFAFGVGSQVLLWGAWRWLNVFGLVDRSGTTPITIATSLSLITQFVVISAALCHLHAAWSAEGKVHKARRVALVALTSWILIVTGILLFYQ